ncbi:MAG: zinc dependent phospholipase C family protein [Candidatus Aegiribacteria sp.]|nr:zinc dependent phospholipase C family protein [Candidatus Aegiribacteria sp.]
MHLPMLHLLIAHDICNAMDIDSKSQFYLGNIAPDAIHTRKGWTRKEKRLLHLNKSEKELNERTKIAIDFYLKNYNEDNKDFIIGYVVHVIVDNYWSHLFARYFHHVYSQNMDTEVAKQLYYDETDKIDSIAYFESEFSEEICAVLQRSEASDFLHLLSKSEITAWKQDVLKRLTNYTRTPDRLFQFFSLEMIDEYRGICTTEIRHIFSDINRNANYSGKRYQEHGLALKYLDKV